MWRCRCNFNYLVFVIVFVAILSGMSFAPKNSPATSLEEQIRAQADQVLASLKSTYESENLPDFMDLLDRGFENRLAFQSSLENYFISNKHPELLVITDAVLVNKNKVSVRLHWFKKIFTNGGAFSKSQGSAQFAFNKTAQGLKLLYLRGDNPFF